jgi:hypothetical protein
MIKKRLSTFTLAIFFALGAAMMGVNAQAAEEVPQDVFDEAHYGSRMQFLLKELQAAHEATKDPRKSQGEVEEAKQKAFKTARQMLLLIDNRIHNLDIRSGAQLSPTEILVNTHVMVVLLDLLVGETLPHKDEWQYIY